MHFVFLWHPPVWVWAMSTISTKSELSNAVIILLPIRENVGGKSFPGMNLKGNRSVWAILNWLYIVSEKSCLIKGHNIHITPVFLCVMSHILTRYCSYLALVLLKSWLGTAHILTQYCSCLDSVLLIFWLSTSQVLTQYCSYLDLVLLLSWLSTALLFDSWIMILSLRRNCTGPSTCTHSALMEETHSRLVFMPAVYEAVLWELDQMCLEE